MRSIAIYAPDIHSYDAVGNHSIGLAKLWSRQGHKVQLYAARSSGAAVRIRRPHELLRDSSNFDLMFVIYSIHDPMLEEIAKINCKKVCYFHGITPPELVEQYDPISAKLCRDGYEQLKQFVMFETIICNSRQSADVLRLSGLSNVGPIIPPVLLDVGMFRQFHRYKMPKRMVTQLLSVGRIVPHKKLEKLILVVSEVSRAHKGVVRLNIVGSASNAQYYADLLKLADSLDVLRDITFSGKLHEPDLLDAYRSSDILLSTSSHEGFGVPALEALYVGIPAFILAGTSSDEFIEPKELVCNDERTMVRRVLNFIDAESENLCLTPEVLQKNALETLDRASPESWASVFRYVVGTAPEDVGRLR